MATLTKRLCLAVFLLCLCACAGQQKELLEKDYLTMNNTDLLLYYDNLTAEIARCEGDRNRTSVGLGTGYGSGSGVGVFLGLSHGISTCNPDKLRMRRSDVLLEMNRRGLKPHIAPPADESNR